jgi:hypothetical protein
MHVRGNVVTLHVTAAGIDSGSHYAVFVDRAAVAAGAAVPSAADVVESGGATVVVAGLTVGRHALTVVAVDASGRRVTPASTTLSVTVNGPATTVSAPLTVRSGQPVQLTLNTFGVTIVDIPSDLSGRTAHYEVLVDGALPKAGQTITTAAALRTSAIVVTGPALRPGRHVIWIVLADGANQVLDPLVAAQAVVRVSA